MSEEIQGASLAVPRALMLSLLINGVLGFAMILALMFCIGDLEAALESQETLGYPFLEIFLQAVDSKAGATVMASIILALGICSTVGLIAASSRMLWSFSRDHGTPGWRTLVKVSPSPIHFLYSSVHYHVGEGLMPFNTFASGWESPRFVVISIAHIS